MIQTMKDARKLSQRTGELLIQAGLASGVVADPKGFRVDFTDRGFECLRHLYLALRDLSATPPDPDQLTLLAVWANLTAKLEGWDQDDESA